MDALRFSFSEILSIVGVSQCVYLIVYISFRSGRISRAGLPLLYFLVLGLAFLSDFAEGHIAGAWPYYYYLQWALWFSGPPLSVLLAIQMAQITKTPGLRDYWILLLLPLSFMLSSLAADVSDSCDSHVPCEELQALLTVTGLMAGAISLLVIFSKKNIFSSLLKQKHGKERYWLILALILLNTCFLVAVFAGLIHYVSLEDVVLTRTVLGLAFVYLVSTSLLRIYPQSVRAVPSAERMEELSEEEQALVQKIEKLMALEKVYQEPTYSRTDLARECEASETVISKVINVYFQKSFPQLINEHRIEDARRLLAETDAAIKTIAEDVGFNSLPSFNRVFKDVTGEAPSHYRKSLSK